MGEKAREDAQKGVQTREDAQDKKGTFGGNVKDAVDAATQKGQSFIIEGEVPLSRTCKGRVLTELWMDNIQKQVVLADTTGAAEAP